MSTDTLLSDEDELKLNRIESELDRIEREIREGVREAVAEAVREHGADDVDTIADEVFDSIDGVDAANTASSYPGGSFRGFVEDDAPDAVNAEDDEETGDYHGSFQGYMEDKAPDAANSEDEETGDCGGSYAAYRAEDGGRD